MLCLGYCQTDEPSLMHIYAFGSICRGDISADSDVDLLALVERRDPRFNPDKFSIYSYKRITELWAAGNAFAWHLALESKLLHSGDGEDFIKKLGMPSEYVRAEADCIRFATVFESSLSSIEEGTPSLVFELSTIFLAIRNIATCYSLVKLSTPTFGRDSARKLGPKSISISDSAYLTLMRARVLSTRGVGSDIGDIDLPKLLDELQSCQLWMERLCTEVGKNG